MHDYLEIHRILEMIRTSDDLEDVLRQVERIHGHVCPHLSLGVKAGYFGKQAMSKKKGRKDLLAVVECNTCFAVGVQLVTGCTLGNKTLIFKDLDRHAVTLSDRRNGQAVRLAVRDTYRQQMITRNPEAARLFHTVVSERRGTSEEVRRLQQLWVKLAREELQVPLKAQFAISRSSLAQCRIQDPNQAMGPYHCGHLLAVPGPISGPRA